LNLSRDSGPAFDGIMEEAVLAFEEGGEAGVEAVCQRHPEHAVAIRRAVEAYAQLEAQAPFGRAVRRGVLQPGDSAGRYRIVSSLGRGANGEVFRAHDDECNRDVAVKVLAPFATMSGPAIEVMQREARMLARVKHPNIVEVLDFGTTREGVQYLVMELVDGSSLAEILERNRLRAVAELGARDLLPSGGRVSASTLADSYAEAAVRLTIALADALAKSHRSGIVHRDVKPSNILVDQHGTPHLADFGIARDLQQATLSGPGRQPGSLVYMAPEQIHADRNAPIAAGTDVYSLGVTLHEILALRPPFESNSFEGQYAKVMNEDAPRLRRANPGVTRDLEAICQKAIEKDPRHRYASAEEFSDDLRRLLRFAPVRARSIGPIRRVLRRASRNRMMTAVLSVLVVAAGFSIWLGMLVSGRDARMKHIDWVVNECYEEFASPKLDVVRLRELADELERLAPTGVEVGVIKNFVTQLERIDAANQALDRSSRAIDDLKATSGTLDSDEFKARRDDVLEALCRVDVSMANARGLSERFGQVAAITGERVERFVPGSAAAGRDDAETDDRERVARVSIAGAPRNAELFLFRFEPLDHLVAGGERRQVPVPVAPFQMAPHGFETPAWPVEPGTAVLVVDRVEPGSTAAREGLHAGDHVLLVDGLPAAQSIIIVPQHEADGVNDARAACERVVRLGSVQDVNEIAVEVAALQTPIGGEISVDLVESTFTSSGSRRTAVIRRSEAGFDPPLWTPARVLQECEVPVPGLDLTVWSAGRRRVVRIPGGARLGLVLHETASPLWTSPDNRAGTLPLDDLPLSPGSYLVLARAPGHEDLRLPFVVSDDSRTRLELELLPSGTTPDGFVYVAPGSCILGAESIDLHASPPGPCWVDGFWIGRGEVTLGEYLEFLNDTEDDAISEEVAEGRRTWTLLRIPRCEVRVQVGRPFCRPLLKDHEGRFETTMNPSIPITNITWEDSAAYCRWRTRRSQERGDGWFFRLCTENEWEKAARGADGRNYPWGDTFDDHFCRIRPTHTYPKGVVMEMIDDPPLRFIRDESPFGVFNTAGGPLEWCFGAAWNDARTRMPWRGGSNNANEREVLSAHRFDGDPVSPGQNDGIRLVAWKRLSPRRR
jgi:serine/threonine protein kinase/formylglycine-generating enzyme required for sulfatase activity